MRALSFLLAALCASCSSASDVDVAARAHGVVIADDFRLAASHAGRIARVTVQTGTRVDKDQELLTFDVSALQDRRDELNAEVQRLTAELAGLERGATPDELRELRARCDLLGLRARQSEGAVKELLEAEFAAEKERFDRMSKGAPRDVLEIARAAVKAAQVRLRATANALAAAELRAPLPAIVHRIHVAAGESVEVNTVLVTLRDPARLFVESDIRPLGPGWQLGARVWITSSLLPGERFEGAVIELSMPPPPAESTRPSFVRARIDVQAGRDRLAPGSAVEVELAR